MLTSTEFTRKLGYEVEPYIHDKVWTSLDNNLLIYVEDALILYAGYQSTNPRKRKENFIANLKDFKEGVDYIVLNNAEYIEFLKHPYSINNGVINLNFDIATFYPESKEGPEARNCKHALITSNTLKMILLSVNTPASRKIKQKLIDIDFLYRAYAEYQAKIRLEEQALVLQTQAMVLQAHEQDLKDKEAKIKELELRCVVHKKHFISREKRLKNGYIYIASTKQNKRSHKYKVGRTECLPTRIACYNTGRSEDERFHLYKYFEVSNVKEAERLIHDQLKAFRDEDDTETYTMEFEQLVANIQFALEHYEYIIDNSNKTIETYEQINNIDIKLPVELEVYTKHSFKHMKSKPEAPCTTLSRVYSDVHKEVSKNSSMREEVIESIVKEQIEKNPDIVKWSVVAPEIKSKLTNKSHFRVRKWQAFIDEVCQVFGIPFSPK